MSQRFIIDATYSAHDGGWYAEVYDRVTGKTEHQTRVHPSENDARIDARYWAEDAVLFKQPREETNQA